MKNKGRKEGSRRYKKMKIHRTEAITPERLIRAPGHCSREMGTGGFKGRGSQEEKGRRRGREKEREEGRERKCQV